MVVQNPQHTYRKDGVYYYCRRVPKDLLFKYDETRIIMSLRTKSITAARRSAAAITSRLDEYWMSIRIAEMNIPSLLTLETATAGNRQIKISDALVNYHHLKGIGRDILFFTTSTRFVGYVIDILAIIHRLMQRLCETICLIEGYHRAASEERLLPFALLSTSQSKSTV